MEEKNSGKKKKAILEGKEITQHSGEEATFIVHVMYRQNATWQGKISWVDKQKSCNFRSALEMIKIIDSAVENNQMEIQESV